MGITEAAERQKVTLRILRALRRTTAYPAPFLWWGTAGAQRDIISRVQDWYGTLYKDIFESLSWNSNTRKATFGTTAIKDILFKVGLDFPDEPTAQTTDHGAVWFAEVQPRVIGVGLRTWCIALDEVSQNIKVFDLWARWGTDFGGFLQFPYVPKLPQHISLTTPPPNSYLIFTFSNYRDPNTDELIQYIGIAKLI